MNPLHILRYLSFSAALASSVIGQDWTDEQLTKECEGFQSRDLTTQIEQVAKLLANQEQAFGAIVARIHGDHREYQIKIDRLLDERGCVDNGGPALGMTRTCAHGARVDARRAREACEACEACGTRRELWRCLTCGDASCGRYANGHSRAHARASEGRCVVMLSWDDLSVWCHECESYVDPESSAALRACVAAAALAKFGDRDGGGMV